MFPCGHRRLRQENSNECKLRDVGIALTKANVYNMIEALLVCHLSIAV